MGMVPHATDVLLQHILSQNHQHIPIKLTYGMQPRIPAFPTPDFDRINYGERLVAERLQLLKKARQIALEVSMLEGDS